MTKDKQIKSELKRLKLDAEILQLKADALIIGRPVRILSDYNGQPYGRSKRSLKLNVTKPWSVNRSCAIGLFKKGWTSKMRLNFLCVWLPQALY